MGFYIFYNKPICILEHTFSREMGIYINFYIIFVPFNQF